MERMDSKPWNQKRYLEPTFPIYLWDAYLRGFSLHWHDCIEIIKIQSGHIRAQIEGKYFELETNDILFINPNYIHGFFDAGFGTKVTLAQIGLGFLDPSLSEIRDMIFTHTSLAKDPFFSQRKNPQLHGKVLSLFDKANTETKQQTPGYRLAIKSTMFELFLLLFREAPIQQISNLDILKRANRNVILDKVFKYVHENYAEEISLDTIAEVAHLSKYHFARFFHQHTGQTFHIYLTRLRLTRAESLLIDTNDQITDIAYQCGFTSIKTFNRTFRTYLYCSPTEYRNKYLK
ncbi:HTH-type transcriptional activator RhaS [bioreactor metagenome]|jgi:AraC-like DNA-binding protein|uniref:HTH-type transcriptional activator RhaS n=1 Tax=bioreactor metagenome TaxID=1076179 RepID=A0A645BZ47_9ZZZZ